ncbi:unnamed protein product [Urochloa humidicola]
MHLSLLPLSPSSITAPPLLGHSPQDQSRARSRAVVFPTYGEPRRPDRLDPHSAPLSAPRLPDRAGRRSPVDIL